MNLGQKTTNTIRHKMIAKRFLGIALTLWFVLTTSTSFGQSRNVQIDHLQEKCKLFGIWLDKSGLGSSIEYREMTYEDDNLTIYLEFTYSDIDSILASWEAIKIAFEQKSPFSLEEKMLFKASFLTDLPEENITIALFDTYDPNKSPVFERGISYDDNKLSVYEVNPMSPTPIVIVPKVEVKAQPIIDSLGLSNYLNDIAFLDCLRSILIKKYLSNDKSAQKYVDTILNNTLKLSFHDLKGEIIKGSDFQSLAKLLTQSSIFQPRESISFRFSQNFTGSGNAIIFGDIEGKVGSGFYKSFSPESYIDISFDYEDDWENYVEDLKNELISKLNTCPSTSK